ncbi:MAG: FAD-dependent oxidoreductase, partial [Verrucomicrobiota bacterium]
MRKLSSGAQVVVVGNGMVSARLCRALVQRRLHRRLNISIIGAEALPAYDRVRLSAFVDDRSAEKLTLQPESWYRENGISLSLGTRVERIDRDLRTVRLSDGRAVNYEVLILATGSRPFVPPIEGTDLPNVFVYRTIADLEAIVEAAEGKEKATVVGGGLLGLEAAEAVQKLGLEASVVERARFLMPQQLNAAAAGVLEKAVRRQGIRLYLGIDQTVIRQEKGRLGISLNQGESDFSSDLVILSAGIEPVSNLAEPAGLPEGVRGGFVVNDQLQTDDENIFAIGECALHNGRSYGLVAPGYAMAEHVADILDGKKTAAFPDPDLSTRLKMLGIDVASVGDPLGEGRRIVYETDDGNRFRQLVLSGGNEIRGAMSVGAWPEIGEVHSLYLENGILRDKEIANFEKCGEL